LSFLTSTVQVGSGCTPFKAAFTFWGEDWHMASDVTTSIWELHAPYTTSGTSPVGMSISNGQLDVFGRYASAPLDVAINLNNQTIQQTLGSIPIQIGSWNTVIISGCVDPNQSGYFKLWTANDQGCTLLIDYGNNYGYTLADNTINGDFYHQLKQYDFHQWPAATSPNWDDTYGNVRRQAWRSFSISNDPNTTETEICAHALARADFCCSGQDGSCLPYIIEIDQSTIINVNKQAQISIETNGIVPPFVNATYQAGQSIILLEGFEVSANATFNALIEECY